MAVDRARFRPHSSSQLSTAAARAGGELRAPRCRGLRLAGAPRPPRLPAPRQPLPGGLRPLTTAPNSSCPTPMITLVYINTHVTKFVFLLWFFSRFSLSDVRSNCGSVCSEGSSHTMQVGRPQMDIVCIIDTSHSDHLSHRKRALEEICTAAELVKAKIHHIQVD